MSIKIEMVEIVPQSLTTSGTVTIKIKASMIICLDILDRFATCQAVKDGFQTCNDLLNYKF